jgi:acyl-CoA thioesterase I
MADAPRICDTAPDLVNFKFRLPHLKEALRRERKIKIVAIGSSSTAGEGHIVPYPYRLELALRDRFHGPMVDVLNRGIGGQEAPSELSRFEPDVMDEMPALVIWQVGTNAVFRLGEFSFDDVEASIATGLGWLADLPMDVVLMDLQYTTGVIAPVINPDIKFAEDMVSRISTVADKAGVNVFRRFALMKRWFVDGQVPMSELIDPIDPDKLHMSDWATNCMTQALYGAINQALEADGVT